MSHIWDYDEEELKKTKSGRLLILERMINYGPRNGEKIPVSQVKENWDKLNLFPKMKRLMALLIWGEIQPLEKSKRMF